MKITFLGTGSAFNFDAGNVSMLVEDGREVRLIDCGSTVPEALKKAGRLNDVTEIYLSHLHGDHIGGLELLAQIRYFVGQRQGIKVPKLVVPRTLLERLRALEQLGLGSIQDDFGRPVKATLETYFNVMVVSQHNGPAELFRPVEYTRVDHVPGDFPSYGFVFTNQATEEFTFFTADTRRVLGGTQVFSGLGAAKAKYIFHDCQLFQGPNNGAGDVHVYYENLRDELSPELRAKTWLVHYGANVDQFRDRAKADGFAGFVEPGQSFEL